MQQQNKWSYCESSTKAHYLAMAFPKQLQKISEILKCEGARTSSFKNEVALNIDEIEAKLASKENRNKRNTVDLAFSVNKVTQSKVPPPKKPNNQTLLVELKLRVNSVKNVGATELKNKIECSKVILSINSDDAIHNTYLFIFNEWVKQSARNRIRNLFDNKPNYKVLGVDEFYQSYFS